jgi:phage baseplate assembly protein W
MTNEIVGRGWAFPPQIGRHGGLALTTEQTEIDQAIQIILSTMPGERVMRPGFGCRLHELVFAPNNSQTAAQARRIVEQALRQWEPRIQVTGVDVRNDPGDASRLLIAVDYRVKATRDQRSLVYPFYLIPSELA